MTDDDLGRQLAILATEVRMSRDELTRRFDEQGKAFTELRKEMTTNYVTREHHSSDIGRLTDRTVNVESDLVDLRTSSAASLVEIHGHIDRKFEAVMEQLKTQQDARRWSIGQTITVVGILAVVITSLVVAFIGSR